MAMAEIEKSDTASSKEGGGWGTLEELLLACAVIRHGTESWDSVAMEVQKRANSGNNNNTCKRNVDGENNYIANTFTPQNCEHKYHALKRRFKLNGGGMEDGGGRQPRDRLSLMVDELRKLRVEELRRQLERHDVSIGSLQLKVKKLEDERGKCSSEAKEELGGADLVEIVDRSEEDKREGSEEAEDGSFNESNSTSQKGGAARGRGRKSKEADPVPADMAPEKDCSSSRGDDGSYESEEKEKVIGRRSPASRPGNSGEFGESVSESKREGIGKESEARQSSDVQSSVSLSRRKWRGWRRSDGLASSGDELETEGWSPVNQRKDIKSQPLIKFLEILRSHKHGFVFQRRLPSQETEKYSNLIRQHLDLETVQSKLERGVYNECQSRFYRDLLLVFTNALLFFCKSSTEHAAARDLRKLVTKEIVAQGASPKPKPKPNPNLNPKPNTNPHPTPPLESHIPDPVVKKPRSSTNIVVCRRRSNTSAPKPPACVSVSVSVSGSEKKNGKSKMVEEEVKVESSIDTKQQRKSNATSGGSDSSRKNTPATAKNNKEEESSDEDEQPINQRRKGLVTSRKQGVVNFLKRMQQHNSEAGAKASESEEGTKKAVGGKKDGDEGDAKRRISGRRSGKDDTEKPETVRRGGGGGAGRPPTRKAGTGGSADSGRLKRRRDPDDKEPPPVSGRSASTTTAKKSRR